MKLNKLLSVSGFLHLFLVMDPSQNLPILATRSPKKEMYVRPSMVFFLFLTLHSTKDSIRYKNRHL